jgi:hypothetical protein
MTLKRRIVTGSRLALLGVSIVFFMLSVFPAAAVSKGMITCFSADWVVVSPSGAVLSTSKVYKTAEAYRMDGMPTGGEISKNITSLGLYKQNKEYLYNHDKMLVFEGELDEQASMEMLNLFENIDSEVVLGKENVGGYACTKKKVSTTMDMMGMNVTSTQIIWQSDRFEMPIRIQTEDGYISELRNIDTKRPPGNLFKPFTGYTRVDNMMAVLGMDFSGLEAAEGRAERRERRAKRDVASDPPPKDIRDTGVDSFMGAMEKLMGAMGADPEQTAVLREVFSHALKTEQESDMVPGTADGMWNIIPKRPGDRVGSEAKLDEVYTATLGSLSSIDDVCDFYERMLTAEGWQVNAHSFHRGYGFMQLTSENHMLNISSADNPGMHGTFNSFYNLQLSGNPHMSKAAGRPYPDEKTRASRGRPPAALAVAPSPRTGPDHGETIIVFDRIEATDTLFNSESVRLSVFMGWRNDDPLYLVQIENSGTGLIDPAVNRVCYADSAVLLFGGRQMRLDLEGVQAITPSGVEVLAGRDRERIEAWWDESRLAFTVTRPEQAPVREGPASWTAEPAPTGLLFPNSDFEHGELTNWHATGTAFDYQPTKGDNPTARRRGQPSNHRGDYWIGTFEKYRGLPGQQPGQTQGDRPTGTLTSIPFKIAGDSISFLVGGGDSPDSEYVALTVGEQEVLKATGNNHETMKRITWDVSEFRDREAIIVIVDQSNRGWGHMNADDFRYGTGD